MQVHVIIVIYEHCNTTMTVHAAYIVHVVTLAEAKFRSPLLSTCMYIYTLRLTCIDGKVIRSSTNGIHSHIDCHMTCMDGKIHSNRVLPMASS